MYFAMNRFHVAAGQEEAFEAVWKARDSSLSEMPDFIEFHLLRGDSVPDEGYTPFISKSVWKTKDAFVAWTKSDNFRAAHRNAGDNKAMYLGPPKFEGYTVVEGA
ncbi:antibiotic biosynthesis monooxygenase [Sinorhizobium medicae]|uniref:Antibiotic biosynthesis monooxygenase n=2 Tax=Sinorhizobium medicae TaxID=110321 RepID=A0A508X0G2_9HYPH|nr:antibiotic biosynthesis monooxygenase [Sinorhizobium medicae]ABR61164.1 Antibiotic biosynthesis monooxygenase [Sinorhizobium medicae WSM419]MBO1943463.1 antibiotic biosynthesis monooxygenase [Sinorhizobium medicae]MBO1959135.1 antibiotic biosynthesis monooxygenase [Sinorhizobium medicae]MDX0405653.1 antibiotic biosynthesis monooxygenase [Sinorhizobium medicae]MDX0411173.1 antibiotic biosynthesis monooxygenase [Sinorhizobium medicae]